MIYVPGGSQHCRKCKEQLVSGENIRPSAFTKYDWLCNDCRKTMRRKHEKTNSNTTTTE